MQAMGYYPSNQEIEDMINDMSVCFAEEEEKGGGGGSSTVLVVTGSDDKTVKLFEFRQ